MQSRSAPFLQFLAMPSRLVVPDLKAPREKSYRSDMDKLGIFLDTGILRGQISWMDLATAAEMRVGGRKGKQILGRGPKTMRGQRDWAFDKEERRLFIGDSVNDPVRARHKAAMESRKLDLKGRWVPAKGRTSICGVGNYYGTFAGRVPAMSAQLNDRAAKSPYYKCFVAGAPKFGTYGYVGYTLNKYPEHNPDPYDGPHVDKDFVDTEVEAENGRRRNRKAYISAQKRDQYFSKNPYLVENPPTEPQGKPSKAKPAFEVSSAFRPPGKLKPMKDMKFWGTFHPVDDLGGGYTVPMNPFRPAFYGKQDPKAPYIPPAGPKSVVVQPITIANMARQMDPRKADKQDILYAPETKKAVPFPRRDKAEARLATKHVSISPQLYQRPTVILSAPEGQVTLAPPNKPWFA